VGSLLFYLFIGVYVLAIDLAVGESRNAHPSCYKSMNMELENADIEMVKAKPEQLPAPTYWPFFMALGMALAAWGLLSTWVISMGGLIVFVTALIGWINILRHE
jgi:hypothetical protein